MKCSTSMLAVAGALLLSACGFETGSEEDLGEISQALVTGTWNQVVLVPDDYVYDSAGARVCRGAANPIPGRTVSGGCTYTISNTTQKESNFQYLFASSRYSWDVAMIPQGRNPPIPNPNIPSRMVASAGIGVCQGKFQTVWYAGKWTGSGCSVSVSNVQRIVPVGPNSEFVRVLISH